MNNNASDCGDKKSVGGYICTTFQTLAAIKMIVSWMCKTMRELKHEEEEKKLFLWERDDDVNFCRACKVEFSNYVWKHHCRNCGGIFCEQCLLADVQVGSQNVSKACVGCAQGNSPGEKIKHFVKSRMLNASRPNSFYPPDEIFLDFIQEPELKGNGSKQSEALAGNDRKFILTNKDKCHCAIKVVGNVLSTEDTYDSSGQHNHYHRTDVTESLWEIPRPSYMLLPPTSTVSGTITNATYLEVYILMNKSTIIAGGKNKPAYVYTEDNTAIPDFNHFIAYRIHFNSSGDDHTGRSVNNHNHIILNYRGEGTIELVSQISSSSASPQILTRALGSIIDKSKDHFVQIDEITASFVSENNHSTTNSGGGGGNGGGRR